jgi:chorismate dehydratase
MKEFKGNLGTYRIIETEDNTQTIWSEYFDENCHNTSGAKAETFYNYIEGCHLADQLLESNHLNIFDVGFGPGLGLLYLLEFLSSYQGKTINYYSIEIDEELVKWAMENTFHTNEFSKVISNDLLYYQFQLGQINCKILIGDGRITFKKASQLGLIESLNAIFQDPFSPKKNPTLWTKEWFLDLKNVSSKNVYMSTYSSSVSIRKSMIEAGFVISNAPGFGKKKTMTKARLFGELDPTLKLELDRSPIQALNDLK